MKSGEHRGDITLPPFLCKGEIFDIRRLQSLALISILCSGQGVALVGLSGQIGGIFLVQTLSLFCHQSLLCLIIWSGFKRYNPACLISNWYCLSASWRDQFEIAGFCWIDWWWIEKQQQTKPAFPFDTNLAPPSLPSQTTLLLPQTQRQTHTHTHTHKDKHKHKH